MMVERLSQFVVDQPGYKLPRFTVMHQQHVKLKVS